MRQADLDVASALRLRAVDEHNNGRFARALSTLDRAQRVIDGLDASSPAVAKLHVSVLITRAMPEAELHGVDRGLACLTTARAHADTDLLPRVHLQTAVVAMRGGMWDRALAELGQAERYLSAADDNDRFAIMLNAGTLRMLRGELAGTRVSLNGALRHARLANRPDWVFKAAHNLGYAEFLAGNLPSALALMSEADAADVDVSRGVSLLDRARVLVESGLMREADETLARAAAIVAAERVPQDLAEIELERARCALALGDARLARQLAMRARDRFGRRGNQEWRRSAELVVLQAGIAAGAAARRLLEPAVRLVSELGSSGARLPARIAGLVNAEVHLALGQVESAAATLAALGNARRDDPITGRMHWHYVRARVDEASANPAAAARRARSALDELARYQARFGSLDLRTASAVHGRRLAELDVSLAMRGGRAAAVFAAVERARAVSSRLAPVRPPDDPVAADLLAELRQVLESLRAVEQDKAASEPLLRKRRELERLIVARSWTLSGSGAVTKPVSLERTRTALQEGGTSMVTFVQAAGALNAVVVGRGATLHDLGPAAPVLEHVQRVRADLDVLAHPGLPVGIRTAVGSSLARSLDVLEAALIRPLAVDGPLVLVSTGILSRLPWASLPSLRGRPLVVAPSATKWLASTEPSDTARTGVIALAGPDLGRGEDEVTAVGVAWPGAQVRTGATTVALVDAMATAAVLHVAAHGTHQPENPLFSSVRMTDGPVFAHELDQRGHAPQHVVLSACEVGLATIRPGDEALGLASVLLNLGTRSVVAGVARVGDAVAAETMAVYHAKLASGLDSAASLAAALAEVDADMVAPFVTFGASWTADLAGAVPLT